MDNDQNAGDYLCPVCARDFFVMDEFEEHKKTKEHRINWLEKQYRSKRIKYVEDKYDITVDVLSDSSKIIYHPDNYTVEVITRNPHQESETAPSASDNEDDEPLQFTLRVFHNGTLPFYLNGVDILNQVRLIESDTKMILTDCFQLTKRENIIRFLPGKRYDVPCTVKPGSIARALHIPILFEFLPIEGNDVMQPFYIGKTIEVKGASYNVRNFGTYIRGTRPTHTESENLLTMKLELLHHDIPSWFQTLAFNNNPTAIRKKMGIMETVTSNTHKQFFKTLLWLEELQQELDIQFYSRKGITLSFSKNPDARGVRLVQLFEKELGENRPCVMVKDRVFVCLTDETAKMENPQWYEGYVHRITNDSIFLGFNQELFMPFFNNATRFNLEYVINRYTMRVAHRALSLCEKNSLSNFLFPFPRKKEAVQNHIRHITCYDQNIENNMEQSQAIQHIVNESSDSSPYIIFGPPGTGKTVTVVEAIKQVLYLVDQSHVLACAPSNTAADVITERLLDHFNQKIVIRLYAASRIKYLETLPERLTSASNYNPQTRQIFFPSKKELMKKRVIVCTFITAAKLAAAEFPTDHFTHVFLDEVGHSMECEAFVGVAGILPSWGHLIMAGDPHQLGPVIRNMQAMAGGRIFPKTGLDTSLLERIMAIPQYQQDEGTYNPNYVTKLVKNYRSHPSILKIPNELFYNSELQVKGDAALVNYFCNWLYLPKKGFPVIFHSIRGEDKMEKYSPSYHNPKELREVLSYLKKLLIGEPRVTPAEIGIITPYRLQVEKLRQSVRKELPQEFSEMKIGSVEDFQGEERKVIIISTVRATNRHLCKDHLYKLGFLKNPKRFNVAVTRAQCLLILVGCPQVLMLDSNWKELIMYIKANGGYIGDPIQVPQQNIDDIISQMQGLSIRPTVGDISQRQVVEVPSWNRS